MRITPEMWRAWEVEQTFSREVQDAQRLELFDWAKWRSQRRTNQVMRAFKRIAGLKVEPEEPFRLNQPNYIHVLAQEAQRDLFSGYERLLHVLGHDATTDALVGLKERLRIAEEGKGNRRKWEREYSFDARQWLHEHVLEPPLSVSGFAQLDPEKLEAVHLIAQGDRSKYLDPDIVDFLRADSYVRALPTQQAKVAYLFGLFHDVKKPSMTTGLVAEVLGITPAAVRWHLRALRDNAEFRRLLG